MAFHAFLLILSVIFANGLVHAEEFSSSISGRVYSDQYFPTSPSTSYSSGIFQSSISAWLELQAKLSRSTSIHTVGQVDAFFRSMAEPNESSFAGKIREAYFSFQNDSFEFRAGQQIIPWGKSDGVNPTDYFTAKDYTLLNPDEEVKRTGAPSAMLSFTPQQGTSPINFNAVFQAYYPQTKLLIPDQAIPNGVQFQKYPFTPTAFQTESLEFGAKLSYLKSDYDFSFSAFRGMNHFAQYVYEISSNQIVPKNIQQTVLGGDLSFTFGDYVFRAETAYFIPDQGRENTDLYGLVQPTHWDSVAGIEHTFFDDFHAQVQFLYRYHVGYLNPSLYATANPILTQIQQNVARSNGLLLNFQRQDNLGGTFRIGYANETSDWTADLFLFGYFAEGQDYLLRPQVSYKMIEGLKFTAGGDFYGGEVTRPLGALKKNSSLFLEGRYVF